MNGMLAQLKDLSNLMDYNIYYENFDLMTEVEEKVDKIAVGDLFKKKKNILCAGQGVKIKDHSQNSHKSYSRLITSPFSIFN